MKLLIILSRFPYPLEKGDKLRAYHQIKVLSKNYEIYLFCLTDKTITDEQINSIKPFCKEIKIAKLNKIVIAIKLFLALFTNKPFQVNYFYQRKAYKAFIRYVKKINPEHIYCQMIRTTEYVKHLYHIPKTLDYMDALSKGIERRIEKTPWYLKTLFKSEYKRLRNYETIIFDYFNHLTIISEQDRNYIRHPEKNKISIVPNGIDFTYFFPVTQDKKYDLLFLGNMNYPPNIDCAIYIAEQINPILIKQGYHYKICIAGANPHKKVWALNKYPNIEVVGWVNDQREIYAQSKLFLAPLQIGTGMQNKLLEAMAMGIPCITTSLANNALQATDGEEIIIADTPNQIITSLNLLMQNPEKYACLSANARKFIENNYSWSKHTAKLSQLFHAK